MHRSLIVAAMALLPVATLAQTPETQQIDTLATTETLPAEVADSTATINTAAEAIDTLAYDHSVYTSRCDSLLALWDKEYQALSTERFHNAVMCLDSVDFTEQTMPDSVYIARLQNLGSEIPVAYNQEVRKFIISYTTRNKAVISRALGRSEAYFPIFEEELLKNDMPLELRMLPVIESSMIPKARSRVGAAGLWQFMYKTAVGYKLEMTSFIDQRYDPVLATRAACKHLKMLYDMYGDWYLALAAYNCGPGNVNKALRRAEGKGFWDIYPYLPSETRDYVPAFIAVNYAYAYHKEHDIIPNEPHVPLSTDTLHISRIMHFEQISSTIGTPIDVIRGLNPQFIKDIVPAVNGRSYDLVLPLSEIGKFMEHEEEIMNKDVVYLAEYMSPRKNGEMPKFVIDSKTHVVKSGENLTLIAKKYGVTVSQICKWNNISNPSKIRIGQKLTIFLK